MDSTEQGEKKRPCLEVFLLGDAEHLTVGKPSTLEVRLHAPGEEAKWENTEVVELLVSVSALNVTTDRNHVVPLHRLVDPEPVRFEVVPEKVGTADFRLRTYLAKQMIMLQSYSFTLPVVEAADASDVAPPSQ